MQDQYLIPKPEPQIPQWEATEVAQGLGEQLAQFLYPLLVLLDKTLDKRLVRTFLQMVQVIITFRDRANGLLLSELGAVLLSPDRTPAGVKRISRLLHSPKWAASLISHFLFQQAEQRLVRRHRDRCPQSSRCRAVQHASARRAPDGPGYVHRAHPVAGSRPRRTQPRRAVVIRPGGRTNQRSSHRVAAIP